MQRLTGMSRQALLGVIAAIILLARPMGSAQWLSFAEQTGPQPAVRAEDGDSSPDESAVPAMPAALEEMASPTGPLEAPLAPPAQPAPPVLEGDAALAGTTESAPEDACNQPPAPRLPAPGTQGAGDFWRTFFAPLPPTDVWNPPGTKRVGLQAGHWRVEEAPEEFRNLGHGTSGGGKAEWEVNLDIARRAAEILEAAGVEVDVLPATVPPRYRAHVFLALHADGDLTGALRGYKLARAAFSAIPEEDDRLVYTLYRAYGEATGLPRDDLHITRRMTGYYAFNSRRYCHAIAPGVPAAIIEMGFLTSAADRHVLVLNPNAAARGIATGVLRYLGLAD